MRFLMQPLHSVEANEAQILLNYHLPLQQQQRNDSFEPRKPKAAHR